MQLLKYNNKNIDNNLTNLKSIVKQFKTNNKKPLMMIECLTLEHSMFYEI